VVRGRPEHVVGTYAALERVARALGDVEIVLRERYALFRTTKIFADAVVMTDAVRLAIHLPRAEPRPFYEKVVAGDRHVTHVTKLRVPGDVKQVEEHLREAYRSSLASRVEPRARRGAAPPAAPKTPARRSRPAR
jgi:hypothetical protein